MPVAQLRPWSSDDGTSGTRLYLWCPGCDDSHAVEVAEPGHWEWDGNLEAPTVNPSIAVSGVQWDADSPFHKPRHDVAPGDSIMCHSFVKAGRWEFLGDCTHDLKGQTVPMVPLPDWLVREGDAYPPLTR
jgi:Family of unknown function (DUF6527)